MTEDEKMEALLDEILSRQPKNNGHEQHTV
jgi:hypothetical protein